MLLLRQSDRGQDDAAKREASGGKRDERAYRGAKATHLFAFSIVALALS
jgi:hypothetical protein